jgi:hypothetical protein
MKSKKRAGMDKKQDQQLESEFDNNADSEDDGE